MYLLDTNVLSEIRKIDRGRADANVARWSLATPVFEHWISAVSVLELTIGVLRLERYDSKQAAELRRWMETTVLVQFAERTLPIDTPAAQACARLQVPDPRPERDAMIAATALVHDLTLVTRNVANFETTGVRVLNPWLWEG